MKDFIKFLSKKTYIVPDNLFFDDKLLESATNSTLKDVVYHFENIELNNVINRIQTNQNELAIFLYRFGHLIYKVNNESKSLHIIHWLMKELCSCEIYYSNLIDEGFYITHGIGTIIGSRNKIGKGFRIYQNCTIGHRTRTGKGNLIGENVTCYAGSKILGETKIGDNTIIGANTIITKDIPPNMVVYGNPLNMKQINSTTKKV